MQPFFPSSPSLARSFAHRLTDHNPSIRPLVLNNRLPGIVNSSHCPSLRARCGKRNARIFFTHWHTTVPPAKRHEPSTSVSPGETSCFLLLVFLRSVPVLSVPYSGGVFFFFSFCQRSKRAVCSILY